MHVFLYKWCLWERQLKQLKLRGGQSNDMLLISWMFSSWKSLYFSNLTHQVIILMFSWGWSGVFSSFQLVVRQPTCVGPWNLANGVVDGKMNDETIRRGFGIRFCSQSLCIAIHELWIVHLPNLHYPQNSSLDKVHLIRSYPKEGQ